MYNKNPIDLETWLWTFVGSWTLDLRFKQWNDLTLTLTGISISIFRITLYNANDVYFLIFFEHVKTTSLPNSLRNALQDGVLFLRQNKITLRSPHHLTEFNTKSQYIHNFLTPWRPADPPPDPPTTRKESFIVETLCCMVSPSAKQSHDWSGVNHHLHFQRIHLYPLSTKLITLSWYFLLEKGSLH